MFFPRHSATQPALTKLRDLPRAWLGSLLLPRKLVLARRWQREIGSAPQQLISGRACSPVSTRGSQSAPLHWGQCPIFPAQLLTCWLFPFPWCLEAEPIWSPQPVLGDLGEQPLSHPWKVSLVLIYGSFSKCSYKVGVLATACSALARQRAFLKGHYSPKTDPDSQATPRGYGRCGRSST